MKAKKSIVIIPARMASTRFPNKPLALIEGKTMIERVWRIANAATLADEVVIATDDETLKSHVLTFGASVIMTSSQCETGTDRVAEAANQLPNNYDIIFSLQGDAVLTPPWVIDDLVRMLAENPDIDIATPAIELKDKALQDFVQLKQSGSSSGTSVTFDKHMRSLYFSKGLIPHSREPDNPSYRVYRHIGLYAYRRPALDKFVNLEPSHLEQIEKLEQLRALENGMDIYVKLVDYRGRTHGSVDNPEDIDTVTDIIRNEGELV